MDFPGFMAEAGLIPPTQTYRSRRMRQPIGEVGAQQVEEGEDMGADMEDSEQIGEENGEDLGSEDEGAEDMEEEGEAA